MRVHDYLPIANATLGPRRKTESNLRLSQRTECNENTLINTVRAVVVDFFFWGWGGPGRILTHPFFGQVHSEISFKGIKANQMSIRKSKTKSHQI